MQPGCKPSAPAQAHPQPEPLLSSPLWGSTYCPRFTVFLIVDLLVVDSHSCCCSHSCRVFPLCSAPMTSASPCTIPQTRPTKLALMKRQRTTDELSVTISHVGPRYGINVCYLWTDCSEIELQHLGSHLVLTWVSCVHTEIRLYTTSAMHSCSFPLNLKPLQLLSFLSFAFLSASLWRFGFFGYSHRCCHLGHFFVDGRRFCQTKCTADLILLLLLLHSVSCVQLYLPPHSCIYPQSRWMWIGDAFTFTLLFILFTVHVYCPWSHSEVVWQIWSWPDCIHTCTFTQSSGIQLQLKKTHFNARTERG